MTQQEKQEIKKAWVLLSAYYQVQLRDEVIAMYAEDVADLPFENIMNAFHDYRKNPKHTRCPIPAQIRAIVSPAEDDDSMAKEAAARIIAAVSKHGRMRPKEASEYIGELGWLCVQKQGGWWSVCNYVNDNPIGSFQAQIRDLAGAQIKLARAGKLDIPPALPSPDSNKQVGQIGDMVKQLADQKQLEPPKKKARDHTDGT